LEWRADTPYQAAQDWALFPDWRCGSRASYNVFDTRGLGKLLRQALRLPARLFPKNRSAVSPLLHAARRSPLLQNIVLAAPPRSKFAVLAGRCRVNGSQSGQLLYFSYIEITGNAI
jgi:hypothetical protein